MSIQTRDVIFTFDHSCNSDCFKWFSCCRKSEIEDADAVFVSPRGFVKHFNYKSSLGANKSAAKTMSNINRLLEQISDDQGKLQAILMAVQSQMNLSLDPSLPRIISAGELKKIESIALPILRAPSPVKMTDKIISPGVVEGYFRPDVDRPHRKLVRSEAIMDLSEQKEDGIIPSVVEPDD